jgi:esterase/lipase superfamily enzyme
MNREYHKWHSPELGRDMELLVFGHAGTPVLVFPTSMGRFYQYEDFGMIAAVQERYDSGALQAFCVDSVDGESWYNKSAHPRDRIRRHEQYERYLLRDVLAFIRSRNSSSQLVLTGCSFGGYHCLNFALRHPDLVTHVISMGGAFDIKQFLDGYYDEDAYFNNPPDFLPNLNEPWYLDQYRHHTRLILVTGEDDICRAENERLARILSDKDIPHILDVWGDRTAHDWPWWRQMAVKYLA